VNVANLDNVEPVPPTGHDEPRKVSTKFSINHLNDKCRSATHAVWVKVQWLVRTEAQQRGIVCGWVRLTHDNPLKLANMVLLFEFVLLVLARKSGNDCEHNVGVARVGGQLGRSKNLSFKSECA